MHWRFTIYTPSIMHLTINTPYNHALAPYNNNNNTNANTRFTSNEFKLKARRSIPTYMLTCNKHITDTQQGQQFTVHTRGVKAGRSLLGNGKEIDFFVFLFYFSIKLAASCII